MSVPGQALNVGVIGCGQWGPNHIRNFSHLQRSCALMCADPDPGRLRAMRETFVNIIPTADYRDVLKNPDVDAVCVSTPSATHYAIVKEALRAGKHVLCEKPLTLKVDEARELVDLAAAAGLVLMVGHVFLFNAGIRKLKEYVTSGELGAVHYAHSERTNLGPFRNDVNALWDLAAHDIAIFNHLFSGMPVEVSARGHRCLSNAREDIAFVSLLYPHDVLVNVHVSWLDPKKVRQITVVGEKKMVAWDDLAAAGPITLYDKRVERGMPYYETFGEFQLLSREGDVTIPRVDVAEPLKVQDAAFVEAALSGRPPEFGSGREGLEVVEVLTAVEESMRGRGAPVRVRPSSR